ncbi:MAG: CDC27 family protein [Chitinophagales bacterium]|nr:CDC27 family protein [Chitinophagales bacterium]
MKEQLPPSDQELEFGIIYSKKKKLLEQLKNLESELPEVRPPSSSKLNIRNIWFWLLLILILIILSVVIFNKVKQPNVNPLIAEYFQADDTYEVLQSVRSNSVNTSAFELYEAGHYRKAIPLFEELYSTHKDTTALFWLGISYLGNDQPKKAIQTFELFRVLDPSFLQDKVSYYLMLAYFQLQEFEQAKIYALQISDPGIISIAQEVLNEINHLN